MDRFRVMYLSQLEHSIHQVKARLGIDGEEFPVVVAVSGGEDSRALLHGLYSLSEACHIRIIVAHIDHGLRPESRRDAEFVRELAEGYGLRCEISVLPPRCAEENIEAWAREMRYRSLEEIRIFVGAELIATAHHESDQAETFLLRTLSGRLATSAYSMPELDIERRLWRPLLRIPKRVVHGYVVEERLVSVLDRSNRDLRRSRNRLRCELIPELTRRYNPRITETLSLLALRFNEDEGYLEGEAKRVANLSPVWNVGELAALPMALRWRVIRILARNSLGALGGRIGYRALRAIADRCTATLGHETREPWTWEAGRGVICEIDPNGEVRFERSHRGAQLGERQGAEWLSVPGMVKRRYSDGSSAVIEARLIPGLDLSRERFAELVSRGHGDPFREASAVFDAEELDVSNLFVRERSPGDRLRVWSRGERKLKKLFQEQGLKLTLRDRLPIVECGGEIVWVPGVARSEFAPVAHTSKKLLELAYFRY